MELNGPLPKTKGWVIVLDSSAGHYWIIEAFHSIASEWEVFEMKLKPLCFFLFVCFPKQTDMPARLKELSTSVLLI